MTGSSTGGYAPPALLPRDLVIATGGLVLVMLALEWAQLEPMLRYDRAAISSGEWWRLFSGHFVHLGLSHTLLNGAGLILTMLLVGNNVTGREWICATLIVVPLVSGAMWLLRPELQWYVGLSGALHALIVIGALAGAGSRSPGLAILGLLALKVAWEQVLGPVPGSVAWSGGPVVVAAHLFGALAGATWALSRLAWARCSARLSERQCLHPESSRL